MFRAEGFSISIAVLDDENRTRVFSERSLANSFGIKGGAVSYISRNGV